jgi:hypothetical protein
MDAVVSRLFVCYVPGLDRRMVGATRTPFLDQALSGRSAVELEGELGADHLPTLLTGVLPHEHRLWQVGLRPEARIPRPPRLTDRLPPVLSTTLQSAWGLLDRSYPLPAIPSRRRRHFQMRRPVYRGRALENLGEYPTVFGMVADSRFLFARRLETLERLADGFPSGQCALEFLELHALDVIQHWQMDSTARVDRAYRRTDALIRGLHERCRARDIALIVLSDHGQEPAFGALPLMKALRGSGVAETDYNVFVEPTLARFWFHTEEARARLTLLLRGVEHARGLALRDLRALHLPFEDDTYGELFLSAEPGWVFFPNDLHHPVRNLLLGLCDPDQRPRLVNPRLRGAHGYRPEHPSERGFALIADPRVRAARPTGALIDVAPTLLALLGEPPPSYMRGRPLFVPAA